MKTKNVFWGLFFLCCAVFVIVNRLGFMENLNLFSFVFSIFMVSIIIKSIPKLNFPGMLFPAAFICILYDNKLGIEDLTPWPVLGAAFFGSIGLSILFQKNINDRMFGPRGNHHSHTFQKNLSEEEVIQMSQSNSVECRTSFGTSTKYIKADSFERADLKCSFGELKVYFDEAVIPGEVAEVYVDVTCGSMELFFPKDWYVVNNASVVLAGFDEHNRENVDAMKKIIIKGNVFLAELSIHYI